MRKSCTNRGLPLLVLFGSILVIGASNINNLLSNNHPIQISRLERV